jgi:hypothetical protein
LRSRWTPNTFQPARARWSEQASPNPEDAPRTRAQRVAASFAKAGDISRTGSLKLLVSSLELNPRNRRLETGD